MSDVSFLGVIQKIVQKTVEGLRMAEMETGTGGTVQVHEGLKTGDKVLMLRVSHGQRYIILSKL